MKILAIDPGTTESGYCLMEGYDKALEAAGKIDPDNLQDMIKAGRCGPIVAVSQC